MGKLKPEKVAEELHEQGIEVTPEQAKLIFDFLRKLSAIIVTQYLENENRGLIYKGEHRRTS